MTAPPARAPKRVRATTASHPGQRAENQDALLDRSDLGLWAVADGAGGHFAGAAAARAVVAALDAIPAGLAAAELVAQLRLRLEGVHAGLLREADAPGGATMAATVVALLVRGAHFACLWAGDSRAYRLRLGVLEQLTRDHSLVQELVAYGDILPDDAERHPQSNVITRAVGVGELELEKVAGPLAGGDRFLLCSDGVSKTLDATTLAWLLTGAEGDMAGQVVRAALSKGAADNITAVVVDLLD